MSHVISEGDGISILVEVRDCDDARLAAGDGADGLVLRGLVDGVRAVSPLPLLVYGPSPRDAADASADAVVVAADDEPERLVSLLEQAASLGLESVVRVRDEDDLELVLEHVDPEILLLCADEADDDEQPVERLLTLLRDVPAGKLAVAELASASRADIEELERAGVDAVVVAGVRRPPRGGRPAGGLGTRFRRPARLTHGDVDEPARRRGAALAVAVFLSGAVLLGLEIAASRVLAPAFGSSLYVWGALIGVVLSGLAVGYWTGGVLADRRPTPYLFVSVLALGAALVLLVPVVDERVVERVVAWDAGPRLDPLLAAAVLFGPPSVVLASATPIAVRLAARSIDTLGTVAGRLFAVSTLGSIVGTFVTAFWLVPELGTDQVIASGAVALLAAAAFVSLAERLLAAATALAIGAAAAALAVAALAPDTGGRLEAAAVRNYSPVYRLQESRTPRALDPADVATLASGFELREARDTRYHRLLVVDDEKSRFLRFDNSFQSGMYLADPYRTRFRYTDYLSLGLAYAPRAQRVLFVGLGGGSAPKRLWRDFPSLDLKVVEIDPDVVAAAYRWFHLPKDPRLRVAVEDGRRYLRRDSSRWDVIVVDAYYSDAIPFHLATIEFVRLLQSRLTPGGAVVVNVIGALRGDGSRLLRSITKTYGAVFPTVALHPVYLGPQDHILDEVRNVVLVASDGAAPTRAFLQRRWNTIRARVPAAPDLRGAIHDRWERPVPVADVPLLTDDYAPTDALLLP